MKSKSRRQSLQQAKLDRRTASVHEWHTRKNNRQIRMFSMYVVTHPISFIIRLHHKFRHNLLLTLG